ncbi:hypothetical protein PG993_007531 [Apiospora rasikravindrae]|uniref:Uncharacterized protein n=1 Tax=Apiospora rasikravindrae TaxID=990691 RepID=A0ABR1SXS4_9PEZI
MLRIGRISPYGPRPRRSARLVMVWIALFAFIVLVTYWINARERAATTVMASEPLAENIMHDNIARDDALRNKIRPPTAQRPSRVPRF